MLLPDSPNTGLQSPAIHFLFFFITHILLYACNIEQLESMVAPLSFIAHVYNISTLTKTNAISVSLVKHIKLSRIFCIISMILVLGILTIRWLLLLLMTTIEEISLMTVALQVCSVLLFVIGNVLFYRKTSSSDFEIELASDNLNDLMIRLKKFDQGTDLCIILVCLLLVIFAEIKFTHLLTIFIVILLMVQEDFRKKLKTRNIIKYKIYRFFLMFVCSVLFVNLLVCYLMEKTELSKGLPMIIIVMFFKVKEITFKVKLGILNMTKKYYSNPELPFFRKQVISSFLPGSEREVSNYEADSPHDEGSLMSFKSFKGKSSEVFKFEDDVESLMSHQKDPNIKHPLLQLDDDPTTLPDEPTNLLPSNRQKSKFASYFIPHLYLILAENWKDGQSIVEAMNQNSETFHNHLPNFCDKPMQLSFLSSLLSQLKSRLFLYNLTFLAKIKLLWMVLKNNYGFINFSALICLNIYFIFFSEMPIGFFAFLIFCFMSLTFCSADDLGLTFRIGKYFFLPILYVLNLCMLLQLAILNDPLLDPLSPVIQASNYIPESLKVKSFLLLILWRFHIKFMGTGLAFQKKGILFFDTKYVFDFLKALRPPSTIMKVIYLLLKCVILFLILFLSLNHIALIVSRNCLFRLGFLVGIFYFCYKQTLTLKILLRALIVTSNCILGLSLLYCFLQPDILTLRQERFLGLIFELPVGHITFASLELHIFLVKNFLLRLSYFVFVRWEAEDTLKAPMKFLRDYLLKKRSFLLDFYFRFQMIGLLLGYMYVTLRQQSETFIIVHLNICLVLLSILVYQLVRKKKLIEFNKICTTVFQAFILTHVISIVLEFVIQIVLLTNLDRDDVYMHNSTFSQWIPSLIRKSFIESEIHKEEGGWGSVNGKYEAIKNLMLIIIGFSKSFMKDIVPFIRGTKTDYQKTLIFLYIFYFILFCVNIHYFIFFTMKTRYFDYVTGIFLFFFFVSINYMIYKFYKIGNKFKFKQIVKQKLRLYRASFLELDPLKDSPIKLSEIPSSTPLDLLQNKKEPESPAPTPKPQETPIKDTDSLSSASIDFTQNNHQDEEFASDEESPAPSIRSLSSAQQFEINISPRNEYLFFEKVEFLGELYKTKFLSHIKEILMDFFLRFLIFYLVMFTIYFFSKNHYLLLIEQEFEKTRLLIEVFILFLSSFNLYLINNVSSKIDSEDEDDNSRFSSQINYLVEMLMDVNKFLLERFKNLQKRNLKIIKRKSGEIATNQLERIRRESKFSLSSELDRTGHNFFRKTSLNFSDSSAKNNFNNSQEHNFFAESRDFQNRLNELVIKHLSVFLRLNPELPLNAESLEQQLGFESISHLERREFVRQLEDFAQETRLKAREIHNREVSEFFFGNSDEFYETSLSSQKHVKTDFPFNVGPYNTRRMEYPNEIFKENEQEEESVPPSPANKAEDKPWLWYFKEPKSIKKSKTESENDYVNIKNRKDMSLEEKLLFYQLNKHNYFAAIFFFSLYDVLKDSIVNIILLFLLNNVNGLTLICILVMFGCRFIFKTHFNDMVFFLSCVFCARLFAFLFSDEFPENPFASFFVLANKNKTFLVCEAFIIGSSIFILIPTMFLVKIVFDDFRILRIEKTKKFFRIFSLKKQKMQNPLENEDIEVRSTKTPAQENPFSQEDSPSGFDPSSWKQIFHGPKKIYINYNLWRKMPASFTILIRNFLITKGHYLFPTSLFLLSVFSRDYLVFFKLYIIYDCFFKFFLKKNVRESKRINRYINIGFKAAQLSVLVYIIYSVLYLMIKRRQNINQILVNIFVLVNFKIILENCLFIRKDKERVREYNNTLHETQNLLNTLSKNEDFLLQKMERLLNYDRILYFRKYGDSKERSLNEYVLNNLLCFQKSAKMNVRQWIQYHITRLTLKIFQKTPRFNEDNLLFLALTLQSRFSQIFPRSDLSILSLLTDDPRSFRRFFHCLKDLKKKMQTNECKVVKKFYQNLNNLESSETNQVHQIKTVFESVRLEDVPDNEIKKTRSKSPFKKDRMSKMDVKEIRKQVILTKLEDKLTKLNLNEHSASVENLSQKTHEFSLDTRPDTKVLINGFKYPYLFNSQTLELRFTIIALLRVLKIYYFSKIDILLELIILVLAIITFGTSGFLLVGFFLFFFVLENLNKFKYKLGVFVYLIFILNMLAKPFVINSPLLSFLIGPPESILDGLVVFLLALSLSTINRKINKRFVSSVELFTESVLRITYNNCFQRLPWRFNLDLKQLFSFVFLKTHSDNSESLGGLPIRKIQNFFEEYENFSQKLLGLWPKLFINLKLLNRPKEHRQYRESFWFRNFSQYNIKSFSSYFWLKVSLLFLCLVFNVNYFLLYKRNVQNLEEISATSDSIDSMLVINISICFLFFLVELIFSKYQTSNINSIYKIPSLNEKPTHAVEFSTPLTKFQRAVSKLRIIHKFLKKKRLIQEPKQKPYRSHQKLILLKYLLDLGLWCYICFIRFIWIPSYDENALRHSFDQILVYNESPKLVLVTVSLCLYLYFDLIKLTGHRFTDIQSILNIDFKSIIKKINFKVYMAIPFLLEFKTVILFVCSKTSLDILKWFKIEDIKALLINAKFYVESEKRKIVGTKENFLMKSIMFVSFFVPFFAMLVIPFIFFSDLNPLKQAQIVTEASLEIGIADSSVSFSEKNFIRLVMIDLIPENEGAAKVDSPASQYSQIDQGEEAPANPSLNNCTKLKSYIASKKIFNYNDILFRQTLDTFSKVHYKLNVSTAFHNYSYFSEVRNNNFDYKNFREFLQDSCSDEQNPQKSESEYLGQTESELYNFFYLGEISMTFETTDDGDIHQEFMGLQRTKLYLKRNCRNGMKYFGIQKNENVEILFYVKLNDIGGEYILKNMQQESSSTFLGMYLFILVFVGMTLIRKNLLNRSDSLWTENIPKANRILKLIDFIELRRREFNFREEEIYYYILLDVFRSTEDIIKKSGTLVEMNYKNYLKQKKRNALN